MSFCHFRNRLSRVRLSRRLRAAGEAVLVHVFREIDSTNAEARRYVQAGGAMPALFVADSQTAGRGRLGRGFFSPPGSGIYMTLAFSADRASGGVLSVTTLASVAVVRALTRHAPGQYGIKWVNDIEKSGKKVCGILAEAVNDEQTGKISAVLLGIGINVTTDAFPPELSDRAGSVCDAASPFVDRNVLIADVVVEFLRLLSCPAGAMDEYRAKSTVLGKSILTIRNGVAVPGKVLAIGDDGTLVVAREGGAVDHILTGEVTVRRVGDGDAKDAPRGSF